MSGKKVIVVTGATGQQGGSVVRFLLEDGTFSVRALTRNADSDQAKELAAKGVEVVTGNLHDVEGLKKAFTGAYGVFGTTNFWDPKEGGYEKEIQQGKNLIDAAKAANVSHFVWSTLEDTDPIKVPHFDSKARIDDYLQASGVPRTSLYTSFYYENFTGWFKLSKNAEGGIEANWPPIFLSDGPIPAFAVADTGAFALGAFKNPKEWIGKDIGAVAEIITPRGVVKTLSEISGKPIKLTEIDQAAFEKSKEIQGLHEFHLNMKWFYYKNGNPGRDFEQTKKLYPQVQSFETWAKAHINEIIPQ